MTTRGRFTSIAAIVLAAAGTLVMGAGHAPAPQVPHDAATGPPQARTARRPERPAPVPQAGQSVTLLPDGGWLLVGGEAPSGPASTAVIVDPVTGRARVHLLLAQGRAWHTATVLRDGTVLVAGGVGAGGAPIGSAELVDPRTLRVSAIAIEGLDARARHSATLLTDGRVLIAGGRDASGVLDSGLLVDTDAGRAAPAALNMTARREGHGALLLADGTVLLTGGTDDRGRPVAAGESFDAASNTFGVERRPASPGDIRVAASDPFEGAIDVAVEATVAVRLTAPAAVETVTARTVSISAGNRRVDAQVVAAEGGRLLFVRPRRPLEPGTTYVVKLSGVTAPDGSRLAEASLTFMTRSNADERASASDEEAIRDGAAQGNPASPWRSLEPLQAPRGITALAGQVLRLNGQPLANVTLTIDDRTAETDSTGRFLLSWLDAGHHELVVDGTTAGTAGRRYGVYEVGVNVRPDRTNVLPFTIWMTPLDTAHEVEIPSPTATEVVVTTPRIPGLEVRIPPNTRIVDRNGRPVTRIGITRIPLAQPPFPLPVDLKVPIYFTVQPGGAYVHNYGRGAGVRLVYPNLLRHAPGKRMAFWHYDPEGRGWYVYGQGQVTPDRRQIVPDPGVAVKEFTGAMVADPNYGPEEGPSPETDDEGDPVNLATGLFVHKTTDLALQDVLPIELTRTYRQRDSRSRPFGIGATHNYEMFVVGATNPWSSAEVVLDNGGRIRLERITPGTSFADAVFEHTATPSIFYKARMSWNGNGWDLVLRNGTTFIFPEAEGVSTPAQAALVGIRDRYGNAITLKRSASGLLTQIYSPNGRWIELTYDAQNRITRAEDNVGRTVLYTYDGSGRLWKVTDRAGGVSEFTYDTSHRMLTLKDARGITYLTNDYNAAGRVVRQTLGDGGEFVFAYTLNTAGVTTSVDVTDPGGHVRRVTLNASGYTLTDTRGFGTADAQTVTYERDPVSNAVLAEVDALGRRTEFTYDPSGNVTSVTRLAGTATAATTMFTYEPQFNLLASITDPLGHTTTMTYDGRGALQSVTDGNTHTTQFTARRSGQLASATNPLGHTTRYFYSGGNLTHVVNALGHAISADYDGAGRRTAITDPLGHRTTYTYNALGNITQVTSASSTVTITYDIGGNPLTVTDARGGTTTYTYDAMNRVATRTDPALQTETYAYTPDGQVLTHTDRKSQARTHTYDALHRVKTATYADGSTRTYAYDAVGRLTSVIDSISGTITRTYDARDRLESETTPAGSVSYTYDLDGSRATMTLPGQPVTSYAYDPGHRLTSITRGAAVTSFGYDAANRQTTSTLPNGIVVASTYDPTARLLSRTYTNGPTTIGDLQYGYDAAGNRTTVGGSLGRTRLPAALPAATYDLANRVTSWNGVPVIYDANGNMTSDGTRSYTWSARNDLVAVSGASTTTFTYDGLGRRATRTAGGTTATFLYDGFNVAQETQGAAVATMLTGLAVDEVFAREDALGQRVLLSDALGSTLELTDASGAVQTSYSYDPFGAVDVTGQASANAVQFTGRENDGTGLLFYRERYYHPVMQRFVSEDPLGFLGGDVNLYAYVFNSPTNYTDAFGLSSLVFCRDLGELRVYDKDGKLIGTYTAANNASSTSNGAWPDGTYKYSHHSPHTGGDADSAFGSNGNFVFTVPNRTGMGVHSGRENKEDKAKRKGPQHATEGCIRTTDEGTKAIKDLHKDDPLKEIEVKNCK